MTTTIHSSEAPASELTGANAPACTLEESQAYCRELTRRQARNFYYGLKLLAEPKRSAMYALYGYMRLVDDIADDDTNGRSLPERLADLDRWEKLTHQAMEAAQGHAEQPRGHLLWPAFVELIRNYHLPTNVFSDMIAGQRQDLEPLVIPTFEALHDYCYRVASVVGVASLYVFGFEGGEATLKLGADRGIAFQLTNILRDLREDSLPPRRRCYLPKDELAQAGVTAEDIAAGRAGEHFTQLMKQQITRARRFYEQSAELDHRIHADARPTLAAMTGIYRGVLEKIAARPERVLQRRVRLSGWSKLMIAWRAMRGE